MTEDDGTLALLTQIKKAVAPSVAAASPGNEVVIPTHGAIPPGLTLAGTYAASASGLAWGANKYVFVIACSGGGGGGANINNSSGSGGGGSTGVLWTGWVLASALSSITIGAGGTGNTSDGGNGGSTLLGSVLTLPGGTGGGHAQSFNGPIPGEPASAPLFPDGICVPGSGPRGGAFPAIGPITAANGAGGNGSTSTVAPTGTAGIAYVYTAA